MNLKKPAFIAGFFIAFNYVLFSGKTHQLSVNE